MIITVPAPQDMADGGALNRIVRWLRSMRAEAERLAARAGRLAESLDDFVYSLSQWERNPAAFAQLASGHEHDFARELKDEFLKDAALKLAAQHGVGRIEFFWQPDGTALARIDAQYEVGLSPKLGVLLQVLAADEGVSADAFVGWKGIDQVRKELLRRAGAQVSKPNLNTMLWRLRAALRKAGLSPDLIQRNPRLGLRLALRRSTPASGTPPLPAAA